MFIRNRKTGLAFPATKVLLARAENDRDLEIVDGDGARAPEPTPEPVNELPVPLDVNQATAEQIAEAANGIGLATAREIVERVASKGPFMDLEELTEITGVGKATVKRNADTLTV